MKQPIAALEQTVRRRMTGIAGVLDKVSHGHLTPNTITLFGLAMHVPIAYLIAVNHLAWAGLLLIIFGLFDALDGALARLQGSVSDRGGFLDASTDRFKEVMLYSGAAYYFTSGLHPRYAVWAVAACGASICVSFVKAKGEAIIASGNTKLPYPVLNKMFASGFFSFQVRMAVLILGLLTGQLIYAVSIVAILSSVTAIQRLLLIMKRII